MLDVEEKARLISQLAHSFKNESFLEDFFSYNDVGIPLSQCLNYGLCELTEDGQQAINETWEYLCNTCEADKNKNYENIDEILTEIILDGKDNE